MTTNHSPLPWKRNSDEILSADQELLTCCIGGGTYADQVNNAALIVRAVNSHAELVAALQSCYDAMQAAQAYIPTSARAYRDEVIASLLNARAALARAKVK